MKGTVLGGLRLLGAPPSLLSSYPDHTAWSGPQFRKGTLDGAHHHGSRKSLGSGSFFTDGEGEAQRGEVTCPRLHRIGGGAGVRSHLSYFPGQCFVLTGCCRLDEVKAVFQGSLREEEWREVCPQRETPPGPCPHPSLRPQTSSLLCSVLPPFRWPPVAPTPAGDVSQGREGDSPLALAWALPSQMGEQTATPKTSL